MDVEVDIVDLLRENGYRVVEGKDEVLKAINEFRTEEPLKGYRQRVFDGVVEAAKRNRVI